MDEELSAQTADATPQAEAAATGRSTMVIIVCFVLGLAMLLAFNMN